MRKLIPILVAITTGVCFSAPPALAATLTILHTNDTHAHLLPWGPKDAGGNPMWGGMSRLATLIGMNRLAGGDILLVDAGDFSVGDFMFQEYLSIPELSLMKALGYDAIALGNHEFDLYPSTLEYQLDEAGFPDPNMSVLAANLDMTGDPMLGYFVRPYAVKQYGVLKVGLIGLLTEATNQLSNPSPCVVRPALAEAQA
jgi:5'-nucleotidase